MLCAGRRLGRRDMVVGRAGRLRDRLCAKKSKDKTCRGERTACECVHPNLPLCIVVADVCVSTCPYLTPVAEDPQSAYGRIAAPHRTATRQPPVGRSRSGPRRGGCAPARQEPRHPKDRPEAARLSRCRAREFRLPLGGQGGAGNFLPQRLRRSWESLEPRPIGNSKRPSPS